ncbi:hypothetical protein [Selenihalanaerobacter shriftii]|uniref:Lipoprotein n=1 Tax=Selenihalanaerobacter shriftii TaxID=142842 RepID=A0A1T4JPI9_9FIRM|nr:hypothetical protein [Selenihalanaerobacter shriftii]SJZ32094.1 hypothetical protein SAMN02745118_00280 [Selenihalanaerobacter shriftii]
MQTKKKVLLVISILLLLTIVSGCNTSTNYPMEDYPKLSKEIINYLEEAYNEEFEIQKIRHIDQNDVTIAYCNPKTDKEFIFTVKTGGVKYGEGFYDEYGSNKVSRAINKYYKPIISRLFPYKKAYFTNGGTYSNWGKIPTLKEMLKDSMDRL